MDERHRTGDGRPWKRRGSRMMLDGMTTSHQPANAEGPTVFHPDPKMIRRAIERRSVATMATVSPAGRPHAATVLYQCADDALFVSTHRDSRKASNIAHDGHAAVTIAVRRLPIGPPASIQFQTSAAVLDNDDPEVVRTRGRRPPRPDHGPRRADPRRSLFPPTGAPCARRHVRTGHVTPLRVAKSLRRGGRGQPDHRDAVGGAPFALTRTRRVPVRPTVSAAVQRRASCGRPGATRRVTSRSAPTRILRCGRA